MAVTIPPKNPITLALNGWMIEKYLDAWREKYLPGYSIIITSTYRNRAQNEAAGGAEDSAHLYNLARDFAIATPSGVTLNDAQAERVYNETIAPNWEGFTKFYPTGKGEKSHHIHVNIDREISNYTKWIGIAGLAAAGAWAFNRYKGKFTQSN